MTVRDHEVLELLREEPELLAVADAVAVTQRHRPLFAPGLLAIPAVALALLAVVLFAPWQTSSPDLFARALAAVGDEPVLHAVVRTEQPANWHLVNLATGKVSAPPLLVETEIWYDRSRGLEHKLTRTDGKLTDDTLQTPEAVTNQEGTVITCAWIARHPVEATRRRVSCKLSGENGTVPRDIPETPPIVEPALAGFVSGYRDALAAGTVRKVGEGEIDGTRVYWLDLTLEQPRLPGADQVLPPIKERVAVDSETYRPLRIRTEDGSSYDVVAIETVAAGEGDFSKPQPVPAKELVAGGDVVTNEEISLGQARERLGQPAFWAGQKVAGLDLTQIRHEVLTTRYARDTGLPSHESQALTLVYGQGGSGDFLAIRRVGPDSRKVLVIIEATEPPFALGWPSREPNWALPPPGFVRIGPFEWGYLRRDGLYVKIASSLGEDAVIAAARALEPIP